MHNIAIDNQHKKLISKYNDFVVEFYNTDDFTAFNLKLHTLLSDLMDYIHKHFNSEEILMQSVGYDKFKSRKELHIEIYEKVAEYCVELSGGSFNLTEFIEFFHEWLIGHIKTHDVEL